MIWGKTNQEVKEAYEKGLARKRDMFGIWVIHFAWLPVWLTNGRTIWLDYFEQQITDDPTKDGDYFTVEKRGLLK